MKFRFLLLSSLCVLLGAMPIDLSAQNPATTAPDEQGAGQTPTAPVVVDGIALFPIRGVSAYPAQKRANDIAERIVAVAANPSISKDSLRLSETPNATAITAENKPVMTVYNADAELEGVSRQLLARVFQHRIGEAIDAYRYDRARAVLIRRAMYALAATLAFLIVVFAGRRVLRRIHATFVGRYRHRIRGVGIQSFQIIRTEQLWGILARMETLALAIVLLTAGYLYVDYVLSLFPWTRELSANLFSILITPLQTMGRGLLLVIPDLVFLAILVLVTRYVLILIRLLFDAIDRGQVTLREFDPAWAKPTYRLVRVAVIAFALVVAYPYIPGSSSQAFKGVSIFFGVLISLGSTSLIGNVIAGYTLTYRRTFKKGDRVKIGEHFGDVQQSRVMATYLRTPKNELIVVPNSKIINEEVINYSTLASSDGLILHTTVGIGYDAPWRQVEAMLLEAAARIPGIMREPKPYVRQKSLGSFDVTYELNAYCDKPQAMGQLYTQLHRNILDLFNEYGVQIMTPAYESDPDDAKVVPRTRWYAAPARPQGSEASTEPTRSAVSDDDDPSIPKAS